MSRYFPRSEYAEDQPLAGTILTSHVLYRGFQSGATVGIAIGVVKHVFGQSRPTAQTHVASAYSTVTAGVRAASYPTFTQTIFRQAGIGATVGTVLLTIGLVARMKGKEDIEWRDRSWRLLHNEGQLEVDDWSLVGASAGALSNLVTKQKGTFTHMVGRTAVGSMVGVVGYMGYRYGWWKGNRES